jgi:hypothetical protein
VLTWIRGKKADNLDPTGEFKKVDQMLPTRPRQTPQDRARDVEATLDWMRNSGVVPDREGPPGVDKLGSVPVSRRTPEQRSNDAYNVLSRLRNSKDDNDDPTGDLKKDDQLLPPNEKQAGLDEECRWQHQIFNLNVCIHRYFKLHDALHMYVLLNKSTHNPFMIPMLGYLSKITRRDILLLISLVRQMVPPSAWPKWRGQTTQLI